MGPRGLRMPPLAGTLDVNKREPAHVSDRNFFGILGALLIGAISPGPSFVLVSRIAVTA
jgi:hypothetical protein